MVMSFEVIPIVKVLIQLADVLIVVWKVKAAQVVQEILLMEI